MVFLLRHLPVHVHLMISSRSDPLLPLARLRARGELVEVRAADLRFTPGEVATYFNDIAGLGLAAHDIEALDRRTEGWIAALQLAALSMQGRSDVSSFIAGFAGDDRYIVDYLVEEVLQRLTPQVRAFLLRTCVLARLSGPLCDAVTGEPGGSATLEELDRANLFLVPLDDTRHWYRYHHLFADMLLARLRDERPDEVTDLHRRASQWYDENGEPTQAVRHAVAAGNVERAADLIELAIPELRRNRQDATIRDWSDLVPYEVVRLRPVLAVGLVGGLMVGGESDGVEERLRDAERWLTPATEQPAGLHSSEAGMVVVDAAELPRLPGAIEMYRAALALMRGDDHGTLRHAQLAIDRTAADDDLTRGASYALRGLALWGRGDLEAAHRAYATCIEAMRRCGHLSDVLACSITLADIRITQGRLSDALRTFEEALQLPAQEPGAMLRGTADMHVGMSQIACERGDLRAATEHLLRSQELGEHTGMPQNPYRWRVSMAGIREAEGDLTAAATLLDEAQRLYTGDYSPNVRPVPAQRARLLAAQGRWAEALSWARGRGLTVDDNLTYATEFEHITLARALLSRYAIDSDSSTLDEASRLLQRLASAAVAGGRTGSVIEILVLQALARQAARDISGATARLNEALTLAEPEGYVRVFAGEGPPMASLLATVATESVNGNFARRLLDACVDAGRATSTPHEGRATGHRSEQADPLSQREIDVLRLLATDLDGPDIARRLFVSVNTMRTHTRSIYAKLGVNNRRAAVRRAAELDILPSRSRDRSG